jgi:hypothetical protein
VELLVARPAVCEVTLTYARMRCRARGLVLLALGLIDDSKSDQWLASGPRGRLKDLRLHVTRLGIFAAALLVVERFPLPRFKAKTHPSRSVIRQTPHTKGTCVDPVYCRLTTELSRILRCSLCDLPSTTSPSTRELDAPCRPLLCCQSFLSLRAPELGRSSHIAAHTFFHTNTKHTLTYCAP